MKRLLLFLIVCGVSMLLSAQSITLSGKVVDLEKGVALSNVIVMLKTEDGKAILRHTTTDEKGTFSLEASMMENRMLTFSLMGYESVNLPLQTGKKEYRVSLKPKTIQMKEVTVKAPKIRTKGDTIVYNVSRFADAQDKTIADVLKKMPGIDVETSGRISYNGKAINKFYIEGLDMLEGRYGIATNSIPQQDVSTIEVMENHQPVRALEEIEFSEQAALNVKLKKDARARWLAVLRGGAGFSPALWKGDLSLMRFKGNGQQMYTYKGNNTGNDVTGQHRLLTVEEMLSRMSGGYSLPSYLDMQTSGAPNLDEDRTLFNRSHTFAGNQLFKLGKDYQLTTRMLYANDRRTSDYLSHTEHFLADSLIVTELKDETRTHTDVLTAEATLQANTKSFFLKNTLGVDASWNSGNGWVSGTYPNREHTDTEKVKVSNRLQWIKNIGRRTFTLTSVNSYENKPQRMEIQRDTSGQHQRIDASAFYTQTTGSYGWNFSSFSLSLNGGVSGVWRSMESELEGVADSLGVLSFDAPFQNWHIYVSPKLQYKRSDWVVVLDVPLHYHSSLSEAYLSPRLSGRWDITSQWTLSLNGQWSHRPNSDNMLYSGLLMRNYRLLQQGDDRTEKETSRSLGLTVNYKNPIRAFFVNGYVSYLHHRNAFLRDQLYQGDYIILYHLPQASESETYRLGSRVSKGWDWWELVSTLAVSYSDSHSRMRQNGVLQPYRSDIFQTKLDLTARPARWVSWEYQLMYFCNCMKSDTYQSSVNHWSQHFSVSFRPSSRWRMGMSGEYYRDVMTEKHSKSFVLIDADLSYNLSSHCEINLCLSNLLNEKHYASTMLGDLTRSYSEYRIRPFNAVVEVYYRF